MANERLTLEIAAKAIGQESIDALKASLDRFSAAAESAGRTGGGTASGLRNIQPAADEASGSLRRLFLAAKDFGEGRKAFGIVELGYFVQSLSGVALAAGTAAGAIGALGYALYYFQNKTGPIVQAMKELQEQNKTLDTSYADLGKRLQGLNVEALTAQFGKAKGATLAAFYSASDLSDDKARIGYLSDLIERTKKSISSETAHTTNPFISTLEAFNPLITGTKLANNRDAAAQQKNIEKYQNELDFLRAKIPVDQSRIDFDLANSKKEESEPIARHQSDALRSSRELVYRSAFEPNAGRDLRGEIEKATEFTNGLGQIQHLQLQDETRRNLEVAFQAYTRDLNKKASDDQIKNITTEYEAAVKFDAARSEKSRAYLTETASLELSSLDKMFTHQNVVLGTSRDSSLRESDLAGLLPARALRPSGQDADEQARQRELIEAQSNIGQISRRLDINSRFITDSSVNDAQAIERAQQAAMIGVATALHLGNIDPTSAAGRYKAISGQFGEQGTELNDKFNSDLLKEQQSAILDGTKTIIDLQNRQVERIQAVLDKQAESVANAAGGLFDAVASRTPRAVPNFIKSQVLDVGRTVMENAVKDYVFPVFKSIIPTSGSPLAKGTIFERAGSMDDPLKTTAAPALVSAAGDLMNAARDLSMSRSGGGGGMPSGGVPVYNPSTGTWSGGIPNWLPGSSGGVDYAGLNNTVSNAQQGADIGNLSGQPGMLNPNATLMTGPNLPAASGLAGNAQLAITAAGLAGAGVMAGMDFARGGASKDLQGAGIVAGMAGTIAKLVAPALTAIPIVGAIAAMALPLIGSFFNGPQQRANAINTELGNATYNAPQALNVTQDSSGNFTSFDAKGNIRTSNFSAVPTVREGSTWEQTHGWGGPPPTFYQVPGGQTSEFGAAKSPTAPAPTTVIIQAMDAQSFNTFADRNHMALGNAVAKHLHAYEGPLAAVIDERIRR